MNPQPHASPKRVSLNTRKAQAGPLTLVLLVTAALSMTSPATASNWEECLYEVRITERDQRHLSLEKLRFITADGSGEIDQALCDRMATEQAVPIEEIRKGAPYAIPGERLIGRWSRYSAMGPNGPVSEQGWSFSQP